jgi:hypothetical protein
MNVSKKAGFPANAWHFEDFELKISMKKKYMHRSRANRHREDVMTFEEFKAGRQTSRYRGYF